MKSAARHIFTALLLALAAGTAAPLQAQPALTEGEVRRVDRENRKITLKHGEIRHIDMPPMTMDYAVKDTAMLDKLQPGDKVRFRAANEGGKFTATELQPAR